MTPISINRLNKVYDMIDPKIFATQIGEKIASTRQSQGLSQAGLARLCGISQQMVADYECGRRRIPACNLAKIAEALDIPASHLLDNIDSERHKRGPSSKVNRLAEQITKLPRTRQRFVIEMLENAVART